jgi:uncharacterized repeat protein (TIGR01451 family)
MSHVSLRRGAAATLSLALLALATISPRFTLAADPSVDVTVVSLPSSVTAGQVVAYDVTVVNNGTNRINHLEAVAEVPAGATLMAVLPSTGCIVADSLRCELAQLDGGGGRWNFRAIVQTPPTGDSVKFEITVFTGEGAGDSAGAAHKDAFPGSAETTLLSSSDPNSSAAYYLPGGGSAAATCDIWAATALSAGDPQCTQVIVGATARGVPVAVGELTGGLVCPDGLACFTQFSDLDVAGGTPQPFIALVRLDKAQLKGHGPKVQFVHLFDDKPAELLPTCSTPLELDCVRSVTKMRDGDLVATIALSSNGGIKGV